MPKGTAGTVRGIIKSGLLLITVRVFRDIFISMEANGNFNIEAAKFSRNCRFKGKTFASKLKKVQFELVSLKFANFSSLLTIYFISFISFCVYSRSEIS